VLSLCHDIAIAAKHLTVERPKTAENPRLLSERVMEQRPSIPVDGDDDDNFDNFLPPGTLVHTTSVRIMLETDDGGSVDALRFAADCIMEWDRFFKLHGLA